MVIFTPLPLAANMVIFTPLPLAANMVIFTPLPLGEGLGVRVQYNKNHLSQKPSKPMLAKCDQMPLMQKVFYGANYATVA
jgi:hypothetical protein